MGSSGAKKRERDRVTMASERIAAARPLKTEGKHELLIWEFILYIYFAFNFYQTIIWSSYKTIVVIARLMPGE